MDLKHVLRLFDKLEKIVESGFIVDRTDKTSIIHGIKSLIDKMVLVRVYMPFVNEKVDNVVEIYESFQNERVRILPQETEKSVCACGKKHILIGCLFQYQTSEIVLGSSCVQTYIPEWKAFWRRITSHTLEAHQKRLKLVLKSFLKRLREKEEERLEIIEKAKYKDELRLELPALIENEERLIAEGNEKHSVSGWVVHRVKKSGFEGGSSFETKIAKLILNWNLMSPKQMKRYYEIILNKLD